MKISVAICTWNGGPRIGTTLDSFVEQMAVEDLDWELLVVNNNSTDDTISVCEQFTEKLPIRVVNESKQGHSHSRNRAIDESRGDFIAWTDDDVVAAPNWLAVYSNAIDQYPQASFFGGKVHAYFLHQTPAWVMENWSICSGVFAERDLGNEEIEIATFEDLPYGANFMTRKSLHSEFRFDPQFGRVETGMRGFDEIDVLSRMLESGHRGRWISGSRIQHLIPESRTTLEYFRDYFKGQGETWIQRGVSKLTLEQIQPQIQHLKRKYRWSRWRSSKHWLPVLTELSNLEGQAEARIKDN